LFLATCIEKHCTRPLNKNARFFVFATDDVIKRIQFSCEPTMKWPTFNGRFSTTQRAASTSFKNLYIIRCLPNQTLRSFAKILFFVSGLLVRRIFTL